jgi:parallel beta-helix repeat protein
LTGARSPSVVDRVLATMVFTDIVDSTERAGAKGDQAWLDLLESHDKTVRQELSRFRGREVRSLGDGFLATFDGPARAIHCAAPFATRCMGLAFRYASAQNSHGIVLVHINPSGTQSIIAAVQGKATSIQHFDVGVYIANSNYVTLDGDGETPKGAGIGETGAGTINKHRTGAIDVETSSNITIRGWQMSASGPSFQPDWVTLDPSVAKWAVGGVRFFGVTNSVIDHNAFNNCTDNSVSLFASSSNTVSNNTADYPFTMNFLVADGSSYNLLSGNVASTGDFIVRCQELTR